MFIADIYVYLYRLNLTNLRNSKENMLTLSNYRFIITYLPNFFTRKIY